MDNRIYIDDKLNWGIHINHKKDIGYPPCPGWVKAGNQRAWKNLGVIIWSKSENQVICLFPQQALDVLDDLRESSEWKDLPFCLDWNSYTVPFSEEKRTDWRKNINRRNRSTSGLPGFHSLRFSPEQTVALLNYLEKHQIEIRELAEAYAKEIREVLGRVYAMILGWARERKKKEQISP